MYQPNPVDTTGVELPRELLDTILNMEQPRPFTTSVEVLGLLIAYELLQEAGIHLPQAIGQSVSFIGGIVVGSAAVEAGIISPIALIVVSVAGICGFVLPNRDLAEAVRLWRFGICIFSAVGGIYGVVAGVILLLLHLCSLLSMGIPYLAHSAHILRPRLKNMKMRSSFLKPLDRRNQK